MDSSKINVLKARCDTMGPVIRLLFWGYALYLAGMFGVGLWLVGQAPEAFSLRLLDTGSGLAGYGFYTGPARIEVDFARDALNAAALAAPKSVYLIGYFSGWAEKLLWLGALGCIAALFQRIGRGGSPFVERGCRAVAHVGLLIIASGAVRAAVPSTLLALFGYSGGGNAGPWWGRLLAGGLILCLSYVFEYGAALQTEADETL